MNCGCSFHSYTIKNSLPMSKKYGVKNYSVSKLNIKAVELKTNDLVDVSHFPRGEVIFELNMTQIIVKRVGGITLRKT